MVKRYQVHKAFTLIELMIVIAIIGILSMIAIPKFADMSRKSKEAATRGNLGALRSALSIYYADTEGQYPSTLETLAVEKRYMDKIPHCWTYEYGESEIIINGW